MLGMSMGFFTNIRMWLLPKILQKYSGTMRCFHAVGDQPIELIRAGNVNNSGKVQMNVNKKG